ncbi:MAG: hypothetical protein AB7P00_20470 [Sandaracinaceae bacterium]
MTRLHLSLAATAAILFFGCDDGTPGTDAGPGYDAGPGDDPLRDDCEGLNPEHCALPWPSDYFLADDATTASGHRVNLGETTLPRSNVRAMAHSSPEPLNGRDGWSVNGTILAYLPGATATGLPSPASIGDSLEDTSPTLLIDAATGERVPHWSEIDESVMEEDAPITFMIRPVVPLEHETRYLVVIRGVVDASGALLPAPAPFAALRDNTSSEVPSIEGRRAHFEELFTTLDGYGVQRADLQLAWDFTTSSLEDDTGWMISIRDQALAIVGTDGPDFTIDDARIEDFTEEQNANIRCRVYGTMHVPLFMDRAEQGVRIVLDANGVPMQNGFADYPFVVNIPRNASAANPMRPIQYGHGLLGSHSQANAGWLAEFGNTNGFIPFGVDWIGMSETDFTPITLALSTGKLQDFATIPERLQQGVVNSVLAMRMMLAGRLAQDPRMQPDGENVFDTSAGFYTGDSQGGIFGGTYMAISTDVTRGILGVPGQPYNLLLNRSSDFDPYLTLMRNSFDDGVNIQIGIAAMQLLWDRAEPGSFTRHISEDLFPNTPMHNVILQVAIGDHQVTTLGAHVMARAVGASSIQPQTRPIWGVEEVVGPHTGNAIVEFDFGLPPEPITNVPQRAGEDPHGDVRKNAAALMQTLHFFQTGEVIHTCDDVCDPS